MAKAKQVKKRAGKLDPRATRGDGSIVEGERPLKALRGWLASTRKQVAALEKLVAARSERDPKPGERPLAVLKGFLKRKRREAARLEKLVAERETA